MFEGINPYTRTVDHSSWNSDNGTIRRNISLYNRTRTDADVIADLEIKNLKAKIKHSKV
jgi:hypothetical protein